MKACLPPLKLQHAKPEISSTLFQFSRDWRPSLNVQNYHGFLTDGNFVWSTSIDWENIILKTVVLYMRPCFKYTCISFFLTSTYIWKIVTICETFSSWKMRGVQKGFSLWGCPFISKNKMGNSERNRGHTRNFPPGSSETHSQSQTGPTESSKTLKTVNFLDHKLWTIFFFNTRKVWQLRH